MPFAEEENHPHAESARLIRRLWHEMNKAIPREGSKFGIELYMDFSTRAHAEANKRHIQNLAAIHQMAADVTLPDNIAAVIRIREVKEGYNPRDLHNVSVLFEIQAFRRIGIH
jgi:hypothetical protein